MVVGVILVGGNGKRLRPLTDTLPKTLIEIKKGWSILHHQLNEFKNVGIYKVYLLISNKSLIIEKEIGNEWNGIKINYLNEGEPKGTLVAMNNCFKQLDEDAVVRNGDIVSDMNLKKLIEFAQSSNYDIVMALTKLRSPYGIVDLADTTITKFVEKPLIDKYINAGIYYIKKNAYPYFDEDYARKGNGAVDVEKTVFPKLANEKKIGAYIENEIFWQSIDNLKDVEQVTQEYSNKSDTEYGYEKVLADTATSALREVYIKAGYKDYTKEAKSFKILHTVSGSGYIKKNNGDIEKLSKALTVIVPPNTSYEVHADENLLLAVYEQKG
ncbi:MAG: nucleotidyltransferase family protein [Candidatus Micrarchaeia archaeon]